MLIHFGSVFKAFSSFFPSPNKAKLQRDGTVSKDTGTWHSSHSVINLLISVQNELISRANSLSKTRVKYFYVFALAQSSRPTAQWTKSLSDTNNPPTLSSAASLERCQVHWACMFYEVIQAVCDWLDGWGHNVGLFEVHTHWSSCWLWVTVKQQANTQDPARTVSLHHRWLFTGSETQYRVQWYFSVDYRLLFFHQFLFLKLWVTARLHRMNGFKCVREGVIISQVSEASMPRFHLNSCTCTQTLDGHVSCYTLPPPISCHSICLCLYLSALQCARFFSFCLSHCLLFRLPAYLPVTQF